MSTSIFPPRSRKIPAHASDTAFAPSFFSKGASPKGPSGKNVFALALRAKLL